MIALRKLFIGLCLSLAAVTGCAEEREPINQVQPNALPKSIFEGTTWYAHQTVIDTPAKSTAAFVGESSPLRKIVWEVQEDFLIARDSRQHIDGIENNSIAGDGTVDTSVVAMYAVSSHFDIQRAYNPSTGEELNVVTENTTDRPWYLRKHFRVDWSKNLVSSEDLGVTSSLSGISLEPVNYYVQEPDHPFAPKFETNGDDEVYYVDIVNKYIASPETIKFSDGDEIPSCFLVFGTGEPCEPGEIAVRMSFLRVQDDRDYEPMEYTADRMDRFGYFLTTRDGYDPDYGVTARNRLRYVNRHNIWEQSHQRDADGNFVSCGTDAECGGNGARCDWEIARARLLDAGQCTIPYRERTPQPIVYHAPEGYPEDMFPDAQAFADEFSAAFRDTVGSLREIECVEQGGSDCGAERDRADARDMFVICHSPVRAEDHEACGPEGTVANVGDLRFNLLGWVGEVTTGPLGYGPSFADPETGEIVSAAAFVYGASVITLGSYARDLVALINGDLEEDDLASNSAYSAWISRVRSGEASKPKIREAHEHVVEVDGHDVASINRSMSYQWMDDLLGRSESTPGQPWASVEEARERMEIVKERVVDTVGELGLGDRAHARLSTLKGTDIEQMMVDQEMILAAGFGPDTPLTDEVMAAASPLRGMNLSRFREMDAMRRRIAGQPNSCVVNADFVDHGLTGLAREISRTIRDGDGTMTWYGVTYELTRTNDEGETVADYDKIADMLKHPIYNAVMAHEVGHTIGLRHNFAGSYDSLNYHPRYWELRDDGNMQSRAWDPMTQQEIDGRIREYQYSTVMDYGNNFIVVDAAGIGHYDVAAIKMGYGDLVEVFESVPEENKQTVAVIGALQGFGWPGALDILNTGEGTGEPLRSIPYTEVPGMLGGTDSIQQRVDVRYTTLTEDPELFRDSKVYDADGRLVVPYRYCGDEFADYEPACMRYDAGADEYETLTSIIDSYWNYYVTSHFMRQRIGFDPDTVVERTYSRYFNKLENANLDYSLFRGILGDFGADEDFYERPDGFGAYTTALGASYQLLTQVLATPEAGCHEIPESGQVGAPVALGTDPVYLSAGGSTCPGSGGLEIDGFDGRELRTGYSLGPDYSFWFLTRSGYFQDKVLALQLLTDPGARVLGQDTNVDIRRFQVSFYTSFQDPVQEVLLGVIGRDWRSFGARWDGTRLIYPSSEQQRDIAAEGILVDPNLSFAIELYSMVFGMAYLPRSFDYSFIDSGRLFVQGGAESVDITRPDPTTALIEFVDERSGLTYQAPSYLDANGRETGIAAQVLMHAQALKDAGRTAELNSWMANVNVLRRLTYVMGFGGDDAQYL